MCIRDRDVNANFGILITKKGYSKSAKNRVKYSNLKLEVLKPNELNKIDISIDFFFNKSIKGLRLSKYEFFKRWQQNTAYFDVENSSYTKKVVAFKEGFANTEYFARKKTLETCVRGFRDFDRLHKITTVIPGNKFNQNTGMDDLKTKFICDISRVEIEGFLKLSIDDLRDDIEIWRKSFLSLLTKDVVKEFSEKYIRTES